MDFSFNEEQQMLVDTTRRFIAERYAFDTRMRVRGCAAGWSREVWKEMAELGLLGLNVPEKFGGIEAGAIGTMLVSNAMGEGLLLEPFLSSAVIATQVIVALGSDSQCSDWLARMLAGELIVVLAHTEDANLDDAPRKVRAVRDGDGWRLSGNKSMVYHAPAAQLLLISARAEDNQDGLFAVATDAAGVTLIPCVTVDEQRAARIELNDVRVDAGARIGKDANPAIQDALDFGLAALCADAFGAMDKILAATIQYSRSRVQFGVPIGSFQALQHRMAEMLMHLEQSRSMSYLATSACGESDPLVRREALSAAKVLMGQAARYIGQQAVQLHGGMGMTDELNVSHYFKRLFAFELRGGTTNEHLDYCRKHLLAA